jgi:hypothetical protein
MKKRMVEARSEPRASLKLRLQKATGLTASVIAGGEGDEGDGDLSGPDEMGGADKRCEHLGTEDFDDHDHHAGDGRGEVKILAETRGWAGAQSRGRICGGRVSHRSVVAVKEAKGDDKGG